MQIFIRIIFWSENSIVCRVWSKMRAQPIHCRPEHEADVRKKKQ